MLIAMKQVFRFAQKQVEASAKRHLDYDPHDGSTSRLTVGILLYGLHYNPIIQQGSASI